MPSDEEEDWPKPIMLQVAECDQVWMLQASTGRNIVVYEIILQIATTSAYACEPLLPTPSLCTLRFGRLREGVGDEGDGIHGAEGSLTNHGSQFRIVSYPRSNNTRILLRVRYNGIACAIASTRPTPAAMFPVCVTCPLSLKHSSSPHSLLALYRWRERQKYANGSSLFNEDKFTCLFENRSYNMVA